MRNRIRIFNLQFQPALIYALNGTQNSKRCLKICLPIVPSQQLI